MEFTLVYTGPLKSKANAKTKQLIRRCFHPQLKALWQYPPLNSHQECLKVNPKKGNSILMKVGPFQYAPLINNIHKNLAVLEITMLRTSSPGSIIIEGGDIDNRLKTLFDSLRMPNNDSEIPRGDTPNENEKPFFCLLEDDILITKVSVQTDRFLASNENADFVHLLIKVITKGTDSNWFNIFTSI